MPPVMRRRANAPTTTPATTATRDRVARRATRGATPVAQAIAEQGAGVDLHARFQIEYLALDEITPYPYNPRDNEKAIPAVASSIRSFGFLIPCVVDANNVLVAGHTRTEAAKLIGMEYVPCLRATHLTPEQINAFRLIDNKVAEAASWDHDLLAGEIGKLGDLGLDFTKFGWKQEEIDCLSEVVGAECLDSPITVSEEDREAVSQRRAPITSRYVLGEFVFFTPATTYRAWADGIRALCNFDEDAITAELKRRLGILE